MEPSEETDHQPGFSWPRLKVPTGLSSCRDKSKLFMTETWESHTECWALGDSAEGTIGSSLPAGEVSSDPVVL